MAQFFSVMLLIFSAVVASAEAQLRGVTSSSLSPFSRELNDDSPGFSVELVEAIAKEAGYDIAIEDMAWKDAQEKVATEEGYLLFGATRTTAREDRFDWVTNLLTVRRVFMTIGAPVESMEAARTVGEIAATSVYFRTLKEAGFDNVSEMPYRDSLVELMSGNVNAVFSVAERAAFIWTRELQLNFGLLAFSEVVGASDIWLAASPGYDPEIMRNLNAAAERLRADGTYETLWQRYFGVMDVLEPAWPEKRPSYEMGSG